MKRDPRSYHTVKIERYNANQLKPPNRFVRGWLERSSLAHAVLKVLAVFGVSLIMADGILTPAQSVLGAIQGELYHMFSSIDLAVDLETRHRGRSSGSRHAHHCRCQLHDTCTPFCYATSWYSQASELFRPSRCHLATSQPCVRRICS